jgi:ABC-type branched-subunit amino acid transport system permease subunit
MDRLKALFYRSIREECFYHFSSHKNNQTLRQGNDKLIGVNQVGQIRFMLMGLGLMLLMIYRPQGIFGDKKELALDAKA